MAGNTDYYDGQFVCCGDDPCAGIVPSTYDESGEDVGDDFVMSIGNDSTEDVDNDSIGDIDNNSTRDIDSD